VTFPSPSAPATSQPRQIAEGTIPLLAVEGSAYDCGRAYAALVRQRYPGYHRFLDRAGWAARLPREARALFERRAPHLLDLDRGMTDGASRRGGPRREPRHTRAQPDGCTSFGVSGAVTLDGTPLSGQTKDTDRASAALYLALRLRIKEAPAILVLAYPGELLGYGFWSTGMSLFRNALYSAAGADRGLSMEEWSYLALAGASVGEAIELARRFGIRGEGNCLLSDAQGESASVEFNAAGVSAVPSREGIATHANHPEGAATGRLDCSWEARGYGPSERECSAWRMHGLAQRLNAERGRLTAQRAMMLLADHTHYPQGICRHWVEGRPEQETTAAVVAEPTRGRLHVVRGQPCANWPVTYTI
jgi:isopenicillin-N N-acyltransferase-like protein